MYIGLKIRLYPNIVQQNYIDKLFGCYRKVYNLCLNKATYEYTYNNKSFYSLTMFSYYLHNELLKNDEYLYLREHNTKILKDSLLNLSNAFVNFFKKKNNYPKFKSKNDKQIINIPEEAISKYFISELKNRIFISKNFGNIKFKTSNKYKLILEKYSREIKKITIEKTKTNKYFASILIDCNINDLNMNEVINNKPNNNIIGIDLGIKTFLVTSNNETFKNNKYIRNNEKQLKKLQKQLSRKKRDSKNKEKARLKLAKKHEKINNQKENYIHNITSKLINENQIIILEDLNISGMMKNHKLAKSIQELSLFELKRQLEYKAKWYNKKIIKIDRYFPSSKLCNNCGYKYNNLKLNERSWKCPNCNSVHDRDLNAAINIKNEGLRILKNNKVRQCMPELFDENQITLVDYPTMDDKALIMSLKSSDRLKQEAYNYLNY